MAKRIVTPAIRTVDEDTGEVIVTPAVEIDETTPGEVAAAIAKAAPFFKTPFNHNTDIESARLGLVCLDETRTQQHLADETKMENILAKFMTTGELPQTREAIYQDAEEYFDLQNVIVTKSQVDTAWSKLPDSAKELLQTPERLVSYIDKHAVTGNREALERVGILQPQKPTEPPKAPGAPAPGQTGGTPAPEPGAAPK